MITFAHVSDLHIDLGERATERARRLIGRLKAMSGLDAVLVTGDIADHGTAAEYRLVRELLAELQGPVLVLPGNHDVREQFGPALLDRDASADEINQVVPVGDSDFLLCDSTIPGESGGRLSPVTLTWLKEVLAERDPARPAVLAFHHPPAVLHIPSVDAIRQTGEQELADLLDGRPDVVALVCGHAHTAATTTFAGRPLVVGPGCVSTTQLPVLGPEVLEPQAPPGYAIHLLDQDGRLVTHFRPVQVRLGRTP
ncbi:metallophosphoesterase [Kineosporia rhizophila]|uniref:metallophosphoesterase n=1 Tax=Kineosporia TaxID=49184 RepID=UPI001E63FEAD|nr:MULTISPECIES: metallophosphoesterase [Kineosporia]MCE0534635.1 metallophosphoesterase [Kineosporia rhizophila]